MCDKLALLSSHLPICLSSIPDDGDELQIVREIPPQKISPKVEESGSAKKVTPQDVMTSNDVMTSHSKVECPVCGVLVVETAINSHLDECATIL